MTFCLMIITKEQPTRAHIGQIMHPYNIDNPERFFSKDYVSPPLSLTFDGYCIGGIYSDSLQLRDGSRTYSAKVSDITNFVEVGCQFCIDDNSGVSIENEYLLGSEDENDDRAFLEKLTKIKANSQDCYATIIAVHS